MIDPVWFSGLIYMESTHEPQGEDEEPLWEELLFLVKASCYAEAEEKLKAIGESKADEYIAAAGNTVRVRFDCVDRIDRLEEDIDLDGAEIFSRYLRPSEVESLRKPFDDDVDKEHKHHHGQPIS